jgi:hypothetical protein
MYIKSVSIQPIAKQVRDRTDIRAIQERKQKQKKQNWHHVKIDFPQQLLLRCRVYRRMLASSSELLIDVDVLQLMANVFLVRRHCLGSSSSRAEGPIL